MAANTPEEICYLFKRFMSQGDIESVLTLYEPNAVFKDESGELRKGLSELRQVCSRKV